MTPLVRFRNRQISFRGILNGNKFGPVSPIRPIPMFSRKNAKSMRTCWAQTNIWPCSWATWRILFPPMPVARSTLTKWNWITERIKENVGNSDWMHAGSLGAIADVSGRVSPLMGDRRSPLFFNPLIAREWSDFWSLIRIRRMRRQGWSFSPHLWMRRIYIPPSRIFGPL